MTAVITAFKGLDGETAAMIKKIVISLFELAGERAKEGIKEGWQEKTEEGRMKKEDRKAKLERKAKPEEGKRGRHKKGL